jgi:hypothetical protein
MGSRASSIDKKIRNERRQFINPQNNHKVLMKTQSMVVGQGKLINTMSRQYNSNRSRLFLNSKDDQKSRHMKSIMLEPKSFRETDKLNSKHHQSVVVFNHESKQIVEAIGPQKTKIQA